MRIAHQRIAGPLVIALAVGCGGHQRSKPSSGTTSGASTATKQLPAPRAEHAAIELPSGDIFIAGGVDVMGMPLASTVLITASGVVPGPDMASPRVGHSLTYDATSGTVLIAGGISDPATGAVLDTTEVFDPATGTISPGPQLAEGRAHHAAIAYPSGGGVKVLFAGGVDASGAPLASAEVLDLASGQSAALSSTLSEAQSRAQAFFVDTGDILLLGGVGANGAAAAQRFDPNANTFSALSAVPAVEGAALAAVAPNLLLVAGGEDASGLLASSTAVNSGGSALTTGADLAAARRDAVAARLSNGSVAVVGGKDASGASMAVEVFTGAPAAFVAAPDLGVARVGHSVTARAGSDVIVVVGGYDHTGVPTASIEEVDLSAVVGAAPALPQAPPPPGAITTYPYTEDFDAGLGAWTNATAGDDFDWTAQVGPTQSIGTGPDADHTSGNGSYLYTESSYPNDSGQVAILEGPTFASFQVLELRFWYHMLGDSSGLTMGTLSVDVSTDGGQTWTNDVWTKSGTQGSSWNLAVVDLSSYAGQAVTLRFRGTTASYRSDMAIDDIQVDDQLGPPPPQPPQPGAVVPFPYREDFESGMGAWLQDAGDDFDWTRNSGGTPSVDTGPTGDHTTGSGNYLYTEASYPNNPQKTAILNGPSFNNFSSLELRFWYHMRNDDPTFPMGSLDLEVSTDGGQTWTSAWSRSGAQGSTWNEAVVDLSSYAGQTVRLRFRVVTDSFNSDVCIDDISVTGTP